MPSSAISSMAAKTTSPDCVASTAARRAGWWRTRAVAAKNKVVASSPPTTATIAHWASWPDPGVPARARPTVASTIQNGMLAIVIARIRCQVSSAPPATSIVLRLPAG